MKNKLNYLIIIFLLSFLLPAKLVLASGFAVNTYHVLEKQMRKEHSLDYVAKKISDLHDYHEWPAEVSTDLKLYVGINWFNQHHLAESMTLLDSIKPEKKYYDLWVYYQAMIKLFITQPEQARSYVAYLSKNYHNDVDYLFLESVLRSQSNDLIGAIKIMDQITKKSKRNGHAYLQRGYFHMLAYSHSLAMKDFDKAIKYLPKNEINKRQQALLQNGVLYVRYKFKQKKGLAMIQEGTALNPSSELVKQVNEALRQRF
jgi:tetratricopeptide (TPR) repeat protein